MARYDDILKTIDLSGLVIGSSALATDSVASTLSLAGSIAANLVDVLATARADAATIRSLGQMVVSTLVIPVADKMRRGFRIAEADLGVNAPAAWTPEEIRLATSLRFVSIPWSTAPWTDPAFVAAIAKPLNVPLLRAEMPGLYGPTFAKAMPQPVLGLVPPTPQGLTAWFGAAPQGGTVADGQAALDAYAVFRAIWFLTRVVQPNGFSYQDASLPWGAIPWGAIPWAGVSNHETFVAALRQALPPAPPPRITFPIPGSSSSQYGGRFDLPGVDQRGATTPTTPTTDGYDRGRGPAAITVAPGGPLILAPSSPAAPVEAPPPPTSEGAMPLVVAVLAGAAIGAAVGAAAKNGKGVGIGALVGAVLGAGVEMVTKGQES